MYFSIFFIIFASFKRLNYINMAKISENLIPDINADWGHDELSGAPYSGEAVQEFIKRTLRQKCGYFHYDENNNRYLVFADEQSKDLYLADTSANKDLLLASFDAPFNYSAKIEMLSDTYNAVLIGTVGNNLQFKFSIEDKSGNNTGENVDCTITIINQGVKKTIDKTFTYTQGLSGVLIELDDYLTEGTNNITVAIKGVNSLAATTAAVIYQIVNLKFTDTLDISRVYSTEDLLEVSCVVEGAGTKIIDWYLDGVQLPYEQIDEIPYITAYTVNKSISLEGLSPGVHSIQYRLRSQVGGTWFNSQTFFRNFFIEGVKDTVIGIATELPIGVEPVKSVLLDKLYGMIQYVPYNLRYAIYNPADAAINTVQIFLDKDLQLTTNITNNVENNASIVCNKFGNIPVKININGKTYEMLSEVAVSSIGIKEIDNAKLNLRAFGRDNDTLKESWIYGDYSTEFEGMYWNAQSGWVDNTLIINSGATASINYKPFENDPMDVGKTIEIEFATRNVSNEDDVILNLTNDSGHGLLITASEAKLTTSDNKTVSTRFKSGENTRLSFVINRRESGNNARLAFIYINGIISGAAEFDTTATIRVVKNIVFGGQSDVLLKQIVIYDKPLSSDEILNNYILYRDTISEMLSIYNRNNITTDDGQLSPEKLLNTLPVMYFTGRDENKGIPYLETQTGKAATKINTYFDIEYQNAQDKTKNFKIDYARVRIQGTSSSYYPRKNYRFYTNEEDETVVYDYQGNVVPDRKLSFKNGAQPVDCWCLKTDYAESSGSHNTGVAKIWNDVMRKAVIDGENKLMTTAQKIASENGYPYDVRTTVDGFPIVVFYRNTPNSPWQFLGKFNFNNDKSTPSVFGFCDIPGFDNSRMQCWEVLNNGHALCNFIRFDDEYFDANWEDAFEARYDEDNPLINDLKEFCRWIYSTKGASDGVNILDESLMEKFKTEKWDHLDVYKMAAYYVYIMRFGAVDQTVKNSMFTSEDGEHFFFINYDNDTIFGVRNDGLLKHGPFIDRQSIDPEKATTENPYVYAGHDSVLWNNLECDSEFMEIVKKVDSALYEAGLTYSSIINMFENEQTLKWCEKVCNSDAHYKYISPPEGRVIESLQGNRNAHRRWWVSERFNLYDAKFVTGDFKNYVVELKIVGEQIPFAKVKAAKRQPYGYEILNSGSLVTDTLNIGDTYEFVSPEGQTLQEGDPISIYSACNISELDLSGCAHCALKVDLSRINSDSVGNSLKKLVISGNNNALDDTTFTGTDKLTHLEYLDVQGLHKLGSLNVSNSLNLKTLLAKDTGLTSVKLAPGCLIERLELPIATAALILEDLPLLKKDGLDIEGDWQNVRRVKISGCPNLTNDFDLIWNWYNKTSQIDVRSLELYDIVWTNVDIDNLIQLVQNTNVILKGRIHLKNVSDKNKLLELESILGDNIFDSNSDLYIYSTNQIFVFGPEDGVILEGDSFKLRTIVFCDVKGTNRFSDAEGSRSGFLLNQDTGEITTVENGADDATILIEAYYITNNTRLVDSCSVLIKHRVYPQNIKIQGSNRISEETVEYTWTSNTENITGNYTINWILAGDVVDNGYAVLGTFDNNKVVITRKNIPETVVGGTLTVQLIRNSDTQILTSDVLNVSVVNPEVVMTYDDNPEVMTILNRAGLLDDPQYLLRDRAESFTENNFFINGASIFKGSNIKTFNEFESFIGVKTIKKEMFDNCSSLTELKLPRTVQNIEESAFSQSGLKYIYIPESIKNIHIQAFVYASKLETIEVSMLAGPYHSTNGCVYTGSTNSTLYIIPPGMKSYIMPSETTSIYNNAPEIFLVGRGLQSITLNDKIQGVTGKWFMYGNSSLTEIFINENHPNYSSYNGCIYNKTFEELIYWPAGKVYSESGLHEDVVSFGTYSFVYNVSIENLTIPEKIRTLKEKAFGSCGSLKIVIIPSTIQTIGSNCFNGCQKLESVTIRSNSLGEGMFASCFKLKNVSFESNPIVLPNNLFNWCLELPAIIIPESVTRIGDFCFQSCTKLGDITCLPMVAPTLGTGSFGSKSDIYVGLNASVKTLSIRSNSSGYDTGDWKTVLQDNVGFTVTRIG